MSDSVSMPTKDFAQKALARIAAAETSSVEERVKVLSSVLVDVLSRLAYDATQEEEAALSF